MLILLLLSAVSVSAVGSVLRAAKHLDLVFVFFSILIFEGTINSLYPVIL